MNPRLDISRLRARESAISLGNENRQTHLPPFFLPFSSSCYLRGLFLKQRDFNEARSYRDVTSHLFETDRETLFLFLR